MILYPDRFAKAAPAQFDGKFEWDFLFPAFTRGIQPMDWDGVVECNNRFLVFETKSEGVSISRGQATALENAVRTGYFTVFLLYGKTKEDIRSFEIWFFNPRKQYEKQIHQGNYLEVVKQATKWFKWADARCPNSDHSGSLNFDHCQTCGQELTPIIFEVGK